MKTTINSLKKLFLLVSIFLVAGTSLFAQDNIEEKSIEDSIANIITFVEPIPEGESLPPLRTLRGKIKLNKDKEIIFTDVAKKTYKVVLASSITEEEVLTIKNKKKQYVSGLVDDKNYIFYIIKLGFLSTDNNNSEAK